MEAMREGWTDDRLDLLNARVEERFDSVDRRFDEIDRRFVEVDRRFKEVDRRLANLETLQQAAVLRLDSIQRAIVFGALSLTGGMIAGFSALIVLMATQL